MHGNHELHQACKNGLTKHVEHLLYYGADINAKNVNGSLKVLKNILMHAMLKVTRLYTCAP